MLNIRHRSQGGVTLIEILIAFVLVALLIVIAVPAYNTFLQNTQIRNATESIVNATQIARAEAVRRNTSAQVVVGPGSSWVVSLPLIGTQVQERSAAEGSAGVVVLVNDLDADGVADDAADTLTFNGMGWRVANGDGSPSISQIDFSNPSGGTCKHVDDGPMRCLRLLVQPAGAVRMCDPAVKAGDPRAC